MNAEETAEFDRLWDDPKTQEALSMLCTVLESKLQTGLNPSLRNTLRIVVDGMDGPRMLVWGKPEFIAISSPSDDAVPWGTWK